MEYDYASLDPNWWGLQPNERRTLRQEDLFATWLRNSAIGYILAVTGFGKTRLGEMAIARCFSKGPERIVNIVIPHNAAKHVWEGVKEKSENKRIRVFMAHTYLSLPEEARTCDLLIIDECHKFTNEEAELFGKIIDGTKNKWIMLLSATLEEKHKKFLEKRGIPLIGQVTMKEARACNYVAEHNSYIVKMGMSEKDEKELVKLNKEFHQTWKLFGYSLDEILGSMQGGSKGASKREFYSNIVGCGTNEIFGLAKRAHKAMRERKVFLQKAPSKLDLVEQIVKMFPNKKILTFSEFTDVADELTKRLGNKAVSYHSSLETQIVDGKKYGAARLRKRAMELFEDPNSGVWVMNSAKSLDEASDIEKVDVGIVISYSSKARQTIQRIGRIIRYKEGKIAYIFILCLHSEEFKTQELKWLKDAIKELDEYAWIKPEHLQFIHVPPDLIGTQESENTV